MPRILVIDDEKDIVKELELHLKELGYDVLTARDGESGLETAKREKPDLLIVDKIMPKMNGLMVSRELRNIPETSAIPIIMLSGWTSGRKGEERTSPNLFIRKPFDFDELENAITELLAGRDPG